MPNLYRVTRSYDNKPELHELPVKKLTEKMVIFEKGSQGTGYNSRVKRDTIGRLYFNTPDEAYANFLMRLKEEAGLHQMRLDSTNELIGRVTLEINEHVVSI